LIYSLSDSAHTAHRPLHSFPTRRSSDLSECLPLEDQSSIIGASLGTTGDVFSFDAERMSLCGSGLCGTSAPRSAGSMSSGHGLLDRKSTRLNSSHLGISYAVFCLKKKTK